MTLAVRVCVCNCKWWLVADLPWRRQSWGAALDPALELAPVAVIGMLICWGFAFRHLCCRVSHNGLQATIMFIIFLSPQCV